MKSDVRDAKLFEDECAVHGTLDRRVITITQNGHALDMPELVNKKSGATVK